MVVELIITLLLTVICAQKAFETYKALVLSALFSSTATVILNFIFMIIFIIATFAGIAYTIYTLWIAI